VETWLDEEEVARARVGQPATFYADSATGARLDLKLVAIDRDAAPILPRKELASALGGHIMTREKGGQLLPERAIYRVAFEVLDMPDSMQALALRGKITIQTDWYNPSTRYLRQVASVLVREAGF